MIKFDSKEKMAELEKRKKLVEISYLKIKKIYLTQANDPIAIRIIKNSKHMVLYDNLSISNFHFFLVVSKTVYKKIQNNKKYIEDEFYAFIKTNLSFFYPSNPLGVFIIPTNEYYREIEEERYNKHIEYLKKYPTAKSYFSKLKKYRYLYEPKPKTINKMNFDEWKKEYYAFAELLKEDTGNYVKNQHNLTLLKSEYSETSDFKLKRHWSEWEKVNRTYSEREKLKNWSFYKSQRDEIEKQWRLENTNLNMSDLRNELSSYINTHEYDVAYDCMVERWFSLKSIYKRDSKHVYDEIRKIVKIIKGLNIDVLLHEDLTLFRARAIDDLHETRNVDEVDSIAQNIIKSNFNTDTELKFYGFNRNKLTVHKWLDFSAEINKLYIKAGNVKSSTIQNTLKRKYDYLIYQGYPQEYCGAPSSPMYKKAGGRWDNREDLYLYLATCGELAIYEISPYIDQIISLGMAKPIKKLRILNLIYENFDPYNKKFYDYSIQEIWALPDIISIVSMGNEENYLLTRILSEIAKEEGYDGIIYKSR
ncbi:MAG: RES family NAD+ phosphorylase, partial [Acholeplasma sp.]|nr:RES family NAD+ phosphorylase [Acholeplasma sp.]